MFRLTRLQFWYYSKNNEIRRDAACIDYAGGQGGGGKPDKIVTYPCHGNSIFTHISHIPSVCVILTILIHEQKQMDELIRRKGQSGMDLHQSNESFIILNCILF